MSCGVACCRVACCCVACCCVACCGVVGGRKVSTIVNFDLSIAALFNGYKPVF